MAITLDGSNGITSPVLNSGTLKLTAQPYVHVRYVGSNAAGGWNKITGSSIISNVGNYYDTVNNKFTVPITGRYLITMGGYTVTAGAATERYALGVAVNGVLIQFCGGNFSSSDTPLAGGSFILNLTANDYVEMQMFSSISCTFSAATNHSLFSQISMIG